MKVPILENLGVLFARPVFATALTLALSACQSPLTGFVRAGIGTDLYSKDIKLATQNLDTYFGFICHQAGIAGSTSANGYPICKRQLSPSDLTLMVHTGFNDIDRRCDGYLAWLEDTRHRDAFYNSQINQLARLTNSVLTATSPAAGVTIGIVAEAFGYAKSAFNDYQTRIMLGYESSTIKTIVSQRRLDFRVEFSSQTFETKPAAVFVLRSYLRICMPYTITMDANTYARAVVGGGPPPNINNASEVRSAIGSSRSSSDAIAPNQAFARRTTPEEPPRTSANLLAIFEKGSFYDGSDLRKIQRVFCLQGQGIGSVGAKTKASVKIFEAVPGDLLEGGSFVKKNSRISEQELTYLSNFQNCDTSRFRNFYERAAFSDLASQQTDKGAVQGFIRRMNAYLPGEDLGLELDLNDPRVRARVKEARALYRLQDFGGFAADHVTSDLRAALFKPPA